MPGYDRTGPAGWGSGTGRGFGPCRGFRPRLGFFQGGGFRSRMAGWGPAAWWPAEPGVRYGAAWPGPAEEKAFLKEQAEQIKNELAGLEKRMAELEKEDV